MKHKIKRIKSIGLLLGAVLGVQLGVSGQNVLADSNSWQKAVVIQPRSNSDFSSSSFQQSVRKAVSDGANYINLVMPVHQSNVYSTDVRITGDTPTDQSLTDAVGYIHSLGVKAAISIHDNPYDNQWRANINPSDRTAWFMNYGDITNHYASLGKVIGIDEIVLGTELSNMAGANYNASNTGYWNTLIQNVRNRYGGLLTYSSQHEGTLSDTASVGFWDKLDYIGVSAYYGMGSGSPSVSDMKSTWNQINNNSLKTLSRNIGKPILFTEVGYQSKSDSLDDPGAAYSRGGSYDPQIQANAYQALMEYWNDYSYFGGVSWWDWSSDPNAGGNGDVNYTPQNKPAETVLKQWFTKSGSGGTATPPATSYTSSAQVNGAVQTNQPTAIAVTVAANQPLSGIVVDVEIYNASGQRVGQTAYENQSIPVSGKTYSIPFTPSAPGDYVVKVGMFSAGWQQIINWNDAAGRFTVSNVTPPPVSPPPSSPPPQSAPNLSIWWPAGSGGVSGVQPFKAVVDGRDLNSYTMFWQVDGGGLNTMNNVNDGAPHKEALVDLSSWQWNPQHTYGITFTAKDTAGVVIATKSVTITVNS